MSTTDESKKAEMVEELLEYYADPEVEVQEDEEGNQFYMIDADLLDEFVEAHGGKVKR